jgi:hypothetical protein
LRDIPDTQTESKFEVGYQVGDLAKELFPNGVEIEFDSANFKGMIEKTKELIDNGCEVIYEATFKEDGIFAMADILVKNGKSWNIYEVKASTHTKEYHINNQYVRDSKLNIKELFAIDDITDIVLEKQDDIKPQLLEMEDMLKDDMPRIDIGKHCSDPYGCDFSSHCWQHIPI